MTQFTPDFIRRLLLCGNCVIDSPEGFLCPLTGKRIDLHSPVTCEASLPPPPPLPPPASDGRSVFFKGRCFTG